jgi:hypothetical protein
MPQARCEANLPEQRGQTQKAGKIIHTSAKSKIVVTTQYLRTTEHETLIKQGAKLST